MKNIAPHLKTIAKALSAIAEELQSEDLSMTRPAEESQPAVAADVMDIKTFTEEITALISASSDQQAVAGLCKRVFPEFDGATGLATIPERRRVEFIERIKSEVAALEIAQS